MVKVKFCGMTCAEDAQAAVALGVDAIGLVFYGRSPRAVTPNQAQLITAHLPPFVTVVGVFVNPTFAEVAHALQSVRLDCLQFHGDEDNSFCQQFNRPYIKVQRVIPSAETINITSYDEKYPQACAILLDSYDPQQWGGTGQKFDWQKTIAPTSAQKPLILAGGLTADNVAVALAVVKPYAVDVSSGIEVRPGVKDHAKMSAFLHAVRRFNATKSA